MTQGPLPYSNGNESNPEARNWAMLCHLSGLATLLPIIPFSGVLVPLILWLIKKHQFPFVYRSGREALNFQISMHLYMVVSALLMFVLIGFLLLPIVAVFWLVFTVIGTIRASNGEDYRYPLTLRLVN